MTINGKGNEIGSTDDDGDGDNENAEEKKSTRAAVDIAAFIIYKHLSLLSVRIFGLAWNSPYECLRVDVRACVCMGLCVSVCDREYLSDFNLWPDRMHDTTNVFLSLISLYVLFCFFMRITLQEHVATKAKMCSRATQRPGNGFLLHK